MPDPYPLDRPTPSRGHQPSAGERAPAPEALALVPHERRGMRRQPRRLVDVEHGQRLLREVPDGSQLPDPLESTALLLAWHGGSLDAGASGSDRQARRTRDRLGALAEHGQDVRTLVGAA